MKKFLVFMLVVLMLGSMLAGCGGDGNQNGNFTLPEWMSGDDAAKLLLAAERLDAQLLKNEGDIFENGADVMRDLAQKAEDNLNVPHVGYGFEDLASTEFFGEVIGENTIGTVIKDGDKFYFGDFAENNNSYDYFSNITDGIVSSAETAAALIDNVKKNVRVVDKWIRMGDNTRYYLHVEENSELLIEDYDGDDGMGNKVGSVNVCVRYKNADGKDVYEMMCRSTENENVESRMTYIPGERYEFSVSHNRTGEDNMDCLIADSSKGYWETCVIGTTSENVNVSYFVMKNDLCYDAICDLDGNKVELLKIMSADRAADMLEVYDGEERMTLTVKFSGFDGIKNVEVPVADAEHNVEGGFVNIPDGEVATVNFENGKSAAYGDEFLDGRIKIGAIHANFMAGNIYTGRMMVDVMGSSYEERFELFKQFMDEVGLTCRRDVDGVLTGILASYEDVDSIIKYYRWNGILLDTDDDVYTAADVELGRLAEMFSYYEDVKDTEELDINDREAIEMNIKFAEIVESKFETVSVAEGKITVSGISLTIDDTTLYVKDEPYKIMLALVGESGGLVHLDITNEVSVKYADEDKFTVTAPKLEFEAPMLKNGNYTLAAYIATSDGIRASAVSAVTSAQDIAENSFVLENTALTVSLAEEDRATVLSYGEKKDFTVALTSESTLDYEQFKAFVGKAVFEYGNPSDEIEVETEGGFVALTGEETEIASGTYRVSYKTENGDDIKTGVITIEYTVDAAEQ